MLNNAQFSRGPETVFAAQLVVVFAGAHMASTGAWVAALILISVLGLVGWKIAYGRSRTIADLPTSLVASAAQGYVELNGTAQAHNGHPLVTQHSRTPCVWFRFLVEEKRGDKWHRTDGGTSSDTFLLRDASGDCVVDPEGAEVLPSRKRTWFTSPYRYTEWVIRPGDHLYALGAFSTVDDADPQTDVNADTGALLAEWKRDQRGLLARFDANGDGTIDMDEWERARAAARAEVEAQRGQIRRLPGLHVMHKPTDGRLFVLSDMEPSTLLQRYRHWTLAQFGILCASATGAATLAVRMHLL